MRPSVERSCSISYMSPFVNTFFESFLKFLNIFSSFLKMNRTNLIIDSCAYLFSRFPRNFFFIFWKKLDISVFFFGISGFSPRFFQKNFRKNLKKENSRTEIPLFFHERYYKILLQFSGASQIISNSPFSFFFHST